MTDGLPETGYPGLIDTMNRENLRRSLRVIFSDLKRTIRILASRPSLIVAGARIHRHQKRAAILRKNARAGGRDVPLMMLVSITARCNLACAGCYMRQRPARTGAEMTPAELGRIVTQAEEIGIAVIAFIGGEPLLRWQDIAGLARSHPRILFTVSTNGTLLDEKTVQELADCRNIVPLVSLEGFRQETDNRRGDGAYDRLLSACSLLNDRVLFFGCAITVTRNNMDEVLDEAFIRTMIAAGARTFIFIQYVPAEPGTEDLLPSLEQRELLAKRMREFNRKYPAFFIGIPGEMELFGGCLAAGRGFVHVSPYGDLEPCPIVPLSDGNLRTLPLIEALQSPLLRAIRKNHRSLHASGRCLLRTEPRWVEGLRSKE